MIQPCMHGQFSPSFWLQACPIIASFYMAVLYTRIDGPILIWDCPIRVWEFPIRVWDNPIRVSVRISYIQVYGTVPCISIYIRMYSYMHASLVQDAHILHAIATLIIILKHACNIA